MSDSPAVRSVARLLLAVVVLVLAAVAVYLFLPGRDARARQTAADEAFFAALEAN